MLSLGLAVIREGRLVHANEALLRLLGRPGAEVVGESQERFISAPLAADVMERYVSRRRG